MADPDMEIRVIPEMKMAEALTFQNDSLGIFQRAYSEINDQILVNPSIKKELNTFLNRWLSNIKNQDFKIKIKQEE